MKVLQRLYLKTDIANETRKRQSAEDHATKLQNQLASKEIKISTLNKTIVQLKDLAKTETTRANASPSSNSDREELKRMRGEETRLQSQVEELNRTITDLEREKRDYEAHTLLQQPLIESDRKELRELREERKTLRQEATSCNLEIQYLQESIGKLREEAEAYQNELTIARADVTKLQDQMKDHALETSRATGLQSQIERLQESNGKLRYDAETHKNELTTARAESMNLRDQIKDSMREASRVTDLENKIEELNQNIHVLEQEKRDYEMKTLLEQPIIVSDREKLKKLQEEQTTSKQEVASRDSKIQCLQESMDKLRDEAETHKNELTIARADVTKLQDQMKESALETSRVTGLESQIVELNRTIHDLEKEKRESEMKAMLEQPLMTANKEKLKRLQEQQAVFTQNEIRTTELEGRIEVLNKDIQALQQDKRDLEMRVSVES
ncbi:Axoneme-associated protein GASP-180 [Lentinula edodes]|uniref:Axoneme-associated protein GASP-180 n=1 Tax=Lentinula edodes TaxID=5353 RepID=A0A1Q3EC50_LENED|nr:Axoneme-associated protein GASP-180 [Lentinula edodes]